MCIDFISLGPGKKEMAYAESSTGESLYKRAQKLKKPTKDGEGPRSSNGWEPLLLPNQKGQEEETTF